MRTLQRSRYTRNVRLFLIAMALHGLSSAIYGLWLNLHLLDLGYPRGLMGALNALPSAIALGIGLPAGWWTDRIGRRPMLILGSLMMAIGTVGVGLGISPVWVGVGIGLIGAGYNLFFIAYAPFLAENASGAERARLFALASAVLFWAGFVGEGIGSMLPDLFRAFTPLGPTIYAGPILFTALLDFMAVLPLLGIREAPRRSPGNPTMGWPKRALGVPAMAFPNLMLGIGAALSIPFLNVYFHERYQLDDSMLGVLFALTSAFTGLATLLAPRIARWIGRIATVALTQGLSIGFLVGMALTDQAALAAVAMVLRGALMNMASPLYIEFCMEQVPASGRAAVSGILNLTWEAGWMVGAVLSGFLQQQYGLDSMLLATAVFYGVGTLYQYLAFASRDRVEVAYPQGAVRQQVSC
ncbi:MFS transporter [Thermoflexus sp.]|uniref:MFS transporter n=1 Tax=Thermoflexus sp. TaxID=1969742 RepID=UPI0035E434D6